MEDKLTRIGEIELSVLGRIALNTHAVAIAVYSGNRRRLDGLSSVHTNLAEIIEAYA